MECEPSDSSSVAKPATSLTLLFRNLGVVRSGDIILDSKHLSVARRGGKSAVGQLTTAGFCFEDWSVEKV